MGLVFLPLLNDQITTAVDVIGLPLRNSPSTLENTVERSEHELLKEPNRLKSILLIILLFIELKIAVGGIVLTRPSAS